MKDAIVGYTTGSLEEEHESDDKEPIGVMSTFTYVKTFLKDKNVASITPTSRAGVKNICNRINFRKRNVIVEYGPATGVFTDYMLPRISHDSKIVLIERNSNFVSILKKKYSDPRIFVYHESAENIRDILRDCGETTADYILSGIPFILFSEALRNDIVSVTYASITDGGKFLPYQTFIQRYKHLKKHLDRYFTSVKVEYFLRNIPPMRIYEAIK